MSDPNQLKQSADKAFQDGKLDEARSLYEQALKLKPRWTAAHNNLAMALRQLGDTSGAEQNFRAALAVDPDQKGALSNLGALLVEQRKLPEARDLLDRALSQNPDDAGVLYNCGLLCLAEGQNEEAITYLEKSTKINERYAPAFVLIGQAYRRTNKRAQAIDALNMAIALSPNLFEAHLNLGAVFGDLGITESAIEANGKALNLNPQSAEAHYNMGNALGRVPDFSAALNHFDQALGIDPLHKQAANNRSRILWSLGRYDDAYESLAQAIEIDPGYAEAHSNLVFKRNYDPRSTPQVLFEEARKWNNAHAQQRMASSFTPSTSNTGRPMRVGFLSPHMKVHPVGFFLEPLLRHSRAQDVDFVCYSVAPQNDALAERLQHTAGEWRDVSTLDHGGVARRIKDDGIDVLVDLDGHSGPNYLSVVAQRVAPIQVTWAGYVGTTGLDVMDYLITDSRQTVADDVQYMTEQPVYMPGNYVSVEPIIDAPEIARRPSLERGHTAFGCFNNLDKINDDVIELWAHILKELDNSTLSLITFDLGDLDVKGRIETQFAHFGIDPSRLILSGKLPHVELLEAYQSVDIALDPFPYSGGLTTIEALWMGVPVVTRADADRFAGRHSVTHLTAAGATELIAKDGNDYVAKAVALAADKERLTAYRLKLREQVQRSPLCDGNSFAKNFESACRIMWRRWCAGEAPRPITEEEILANRL